ncbi:MAG: PepSY-associated TM helix domain-containing protein [Sphingomonas sp.]|uniref:PepSY-associated TM helix domain-containing protein n=1 Tax=Sphingomonas sp. TaxID=28214 RepID=UPI003F7CED47
MTKIGLRNFWFQVHKWIGLILAILIIPLCVTGAALVWDEALDHGLNPQRYAVSGEQVLDPQLYVQAAKAALKPGDRIQSITLPNGDGPVVVAATPASAKPQAGPPSRVTIWLDPPTARVLDKAGSNSGLIRAMHMIHGSMMIPIWGRSIVGWLGVFMLFSCFTGIWLWWPTVGKWVRGLRWRRHRNLDTNLHHLFGFWIALPLFVLSLTGAWISFPQVFGGGQQRGAGPDRAALAKAKPLEAPRTNLDTAIARARAALPGDVATIAWPTDLKPEWTVTIGAGAGRQVKVDDATGAAKALAPPKEDTARLMRRIHDGTRMGLLWQTILFLAGLLPAILAITGVIMWWRARGWKAELKAKRKAKAAA